MVRGVVWTERTLHHGRFVPIPDLVSDGSHALEVWGCTADGWQVYLVDTHGIGLPVSPLFHRDYGDTMRLCKEACQRAYGVTPKATRKWVA